MQHGTPLDSGQFRIGFRSILQIVWLGGGSKILISFRMPRLVNVVYVPLGLMLGIKGSYGVVSCGPAVPSRSRFNQMPAVLAEMVTHLVGAFLS